MAPLSVSSATPRTPENFDSPRSKPASRAPVSDYSPPLQPNWFIRSIRAVFGYRKTSLTFLVAIVLFATVILSSIDNSLSFTVSLPTDALESSVLDSLWDSLQKIALVEHTYNSEGNDYVHDLLEEKIAALVANKKYIEYDNDLNGTNNIMTSVNYLSYASVSYYESNNLLVRVNGSDASLPAFLVSAHYDSVPSSYGVTDDGMGVASMLGLLEYFADKSTKRPLRTVIFNFNNNEEFGLYGATAFLHHPWFQQIKYFLNLEGTGAGGKAILFRGTDYGIVKHFSKVRFPYATSLFQQGFNNKLIHSETDYAIYKSMGKLRGLDLAFYKPRDIYHTGADNIKNTNKKSLWHMLSNTIDFTKFIAYEKIDLDEEYMGGEAANSSNDYAAYLSFFNYFVAFSLSQVVIVNIVLLVVSPILSLLLLVLIFQYKKGWGVNFINVIKFPISFVLSVIILSFITDVLIVPTNLYLVNSSPGTLVSTLFALFLFLNYAFLNGLNFIFKPFKGHQHDEKLIVIIEASFITWVILLWSTVKQSHNKIGDDHTGEFILTVLFVLQSAAALFGLFGWSLKSPRRIALSEGESQPLIGSSSQHRYHSHSDDEDSIAESSSLSLQSGFSEGCSVHEKKSFSYDWLLQFLLIVPLSSLIIYNSGFLVLAGINKSIQESLEAQDFIYKIIQAFVIVWAIPFLPFIFKLNRVFVLALLIALIQGGLVISTKSAFDVENPLKLRFLETIDLNANPFTNTVSVSGRLMKLIENILEDIPSFKDNKAELLTSSLGDGMLLYSYGSQLTPDFIPGNSIQDYLTIEVLRNSSSGSDSPFGLLTGEIEIIAPKNRNCKVSFNVTDKVIKIFDGVESSSSTHSPVKTVIVYKDEKKGNGSDVELYNTAGIPEGFSRDHDGNYLFKDFEGIGQLQLNKLDWDKKYHIAFQWVPEVVESDFSVDSDVEAQKINVKQLGVNVECYWSGLSDVDEFIAESEQIPAYKELLHYSPNYVKWANRDRGLVSVTKYAEI